MCVWVGAPEALVCLLPTCSTWGGRNLRGRGGKWDTGGLLPGCVCESVCVSLRERVCVSQFSMLSSCRMDLLGILRVWHVDACWCIDICLGWRTCVGVLVGVGATACDHVCSELCLYGCAKVTWSIGLTLTYLPGLDGNSDIWMGNVTPE